MTSPMTMTWEEFSDFGCGEYNGDGELKIVFGSSEPQRVAVG